MVQSSPLDFLIQTTEARDRLLPNSDTDSNRNSPTARQRQDSIGNFLQNHCSRLVGPIGPSLLPEPFGLLLLRVRFRLSPLLVALGLLLLLEPFTLSLLLEPFGLPLIADIGLVNLPLVPTIPGGKSSALSCGCGLLLYCAMCIARSGCSLTRRSSDRGFAQLSNALANHGIGRIPGQDICGERKSENALYQRGMCVILLGQVFSDRRMLFLLGTFKSQRFVPERTEIVQGLDSRH